MEDEWERNLDTEDNSVPTRKSRTSILKDPKGQNDLNTLRLSRRVSFSSNFIKAFTTDDDKNTIWDTTVEETINNTESTRSTENSHSSKRPDFNTSLFEDGMNFSDSPSDMELTQDDLVTANKAAAIEKENIPLSKETILLAKKKNISRVVKPFTPLAQKENIPLDGKENIPSFEDINSSNENGDLQSIERQIEKVPIFLEPSNPLLPVKLPVFSDSIVNNIADTGDVMELTCNSSILESNDVQDMELTLKPPTSKINPTDEDLELTCGSLNVADLTRLTSENSVMESNTVDDMEFTCRDTVFNSNDNEDMEFTCKNPVMKSITTFEDMEFTCKVPVLSSNIVENMEVINNPVAQEHVADIVRLTRSPMMESNAVDDMEFTCRINLLKPNDVDDMELTCKNTVLKSSAFEDMEFTCKVPMLNTNIVENMEMESNPISQEHTTDISQSTSKNPVMKSKTDDDMEFTCRNTILKPNDDEDMELTCKNPVIKSSTFENREFTCKDPVLNSNTVETMEMSNNHVAEENVVDITRLTSKKPVMESNPVDDMEFTCRNTVLKLNDVEDMEFTCRNPIMKSSTFEDMEFTCKVPVLSSSTVDDMEFTCRNTVLKPNDVEDMEFTCKNPVMKPATTFEDMEFTCKVPVLNSNIVERMEMISNPITQEEHVADIVRLTSKNPVLESNTIDDMEFTCRNTVLKPNDVKVMDSTCTSPVMNSNIVENAETDKYPEVKEHSKKGMNDEPVSLIVERSSSLDPYKYEDIGNDTSRREFIIRNVNLNKTNMSNISDVNLSQGISLLSKKQWCSINASVAVMENDQTVDLPALHTPEKTLSEGPLDNVEGSNLEKNTETPDISMIPERKSMDTGRNEALIKSMAVGNGKVEVTQDETIPPDVDLPDVRLYENKEFSVGSCGRDTPNMSYYLSENDMHSKLSTTSIDGTQHLLMSASMVNKSRNLTCDENSLGNISRPFNNRTYVVGDEEVNIEFSKEPREEANRMESGVVREQATETIPDIINDLNVTLVDDPNEGCVSLSSQNCTPTCEKNNGVEHRSNQDQRSLEGSVTQSHVEDNNEEGGTFEEGCPIKSRANHEDVDIDEMLVRSRERFKKLEEKIAKITIPEPEADNRVQLMIERIQVTEARHDIIRKKFHKKYAIFVENRNKILEHIVSRSKTPLETPEEETAADSVSEEDVEKMIPSLKEQIEERSKMCDGCWQMVQIGDCVAHFTTLFGKLEFSLEYYSVDHLVTNFKTNSILTDKAQPIAHFLQKELLRALSAEHIHNSIGQHYTVLSLLDYIQMEMEKIKKYYTNLKRLEKSYQLSFSRDFRATFVIINVDLTIKWIFTLDLSNLESITKDSVVVQAEIGRVNERHVLDLVAECSKGLEFVQSYLNKIEEYLRNLMKRKRFAESRKD